MSKVYDNIKDKEYYKALFTNWEATKTIIDAGKAVYELKNPDSKNQKVCMYRDGTDVFFYGSYGHFAFNNLPWLAAPNNLPYDNFLYFVGRLSSDSEKALYAYDKENAKGDIIEWAKESLIDHFELSDLQIETVLRYFDGKENDCYDEDDFVLKHDLPDIEDFLCTVNALLDAATEGGGYYTNALYQYERALSEYDENYATELCGAGCGLCQKFYICMYAMEVCSKKIVKQKK